MNFKQLITALFLLVAVGFLFLIKPVIINNTVYAAAQYNCTGSVGNTYDAHDTCSHTNIAGHLCSYNQDWGQCVPGVPINEVLSCSPDPSHGTGNASAYACGACAHIGAYNNCTNGSNVCNSACSFGTTQVPSDSGQCSAKYGIVWDNTGCSVSCSGRYYCNANHQAYDTSYTGTGASGACTNNGIRDTAGDTSCGGPTPTPPPTPGCGNPCAGYSYFCDASCNEWSLAPSCPSTCGKGDTEVLSNTVACNGAGGTLCPAPTIIPPTTPACLAAGATNSEAISWSKVTGATSYTLRIRNRTLHPTQNDYTRACNDAGTGQVTGDFCKTGLTGTSVAFNFIVGDTYEATEVATNANTGHTTPAAMNTFTVTSAACSTFTISGNVKASGVNASGRTVACSGTGGSTQTTNASGNYACTGLAAGSHTVTLTVPSGNHATSTNGVTKTVGPNQTVNFTYAPTTITGQVYIDYQGNGSMGGSDVAYKLTAVPVFLKNAAGTTTVATTTTTTATGNYSISGVADGDYTMSITKPTGYTITYPTPYPAPVHISGANYTQNFGIEPPAPVCDAMTANPAQIYVGGNPTPATSTLNIPNCKPGGGAPGTVTYAWTQTQTPATQGTITLPLNTASVVYKPPAAGSTYTKVNLAPSVSVCNPGGVGAACKPYGGSLTLIPTFIAKGEAFIDNDKSGTVTAGDQVYANGSITICQFQNGNCNAYEKLTTDSSGNFTTSSTKPLAPGQYKATLAIVSPYRPTTPTSIIFTVGNASTGNACATPVGSCDANGNVQGLNFGISDSSVWMQAIGGDITGEYISDPTKGGFDDVIPNPTNVISPNGAYALVNGTDGTTHGLINTGSDNATFGGAGGQEAAAQNWLVGGIGNYSYAYNMPLSNQARTAYANLSYVVSQSNVPHTDLSTIPGCTAPASSCNLPTDPAIIANYFPSGVYTDTVNGNVNLNSAGGTYTFPSGQYVILVNGDLNINTKIIVPKGSFVLFSVSGNINVANTVGEATPTICNLSDDSGCDLEGYYSTDNSFNALSNDANGAGGNCATPTNPDFQLNVAGAIVVNATENGGSLNYTTRDMCLYDKQWPAFTITERPDFILNAPAFLMFPRRVWQEVAP